MPNKFKVFKGIKFNSNDIGITIEDLEESPNKYLKNNKKVKK